MSMLSEADNEWSPLELCSEPEVDGEVISISREGNLGQFSIWTSSAVNEDGFLSTIRAHPGGSLRIEIVTMD